VAVLTHIGHTTVPTLVYLWIHFSKYTHSYYTVITREVPVSQTLRTSLYPAIPVDKTSNALMYTVHIGTIDILNYVHMFTLSDRATPPYWLLVEAIDYIQYM
jgi:hypothetical protein